MSLRLGRKTSRRLCVNLTHIVKGNLTSQIDLMFTNKASLVLEAAVLAPVSDHCPTLLKLSCNQPYSSDKSKIILDYNSANFIAMDEHLQNVEFSPVFTLSDVNVAVDYFHSAFQRHFLFHRSKCLPWEHHINCLPERMLVRAAHSVECSYYVRLGKICNVSS